MKIRLIEVLSDQGYFSTTKHSIPSSMSGLKTDKLFSEMRLSSYLPCQ